MKPEQQLMDIERMRSELNRYEQIKPELRALFDLYLSLFEIESDYMGKLEVTVPEISDEDLGIRLENGASAMKTGDIKVDAGMFNAMLKDVAGVIVRTNGEFEGAIDTLLAHPDLEAPANGEMPVLIKKALEFNTQYFTELAKEIPINNELMFFIIYHVINPFIEQASYAFRDRIDYDKWQRTECPVCSKKPGMALLTGDDGARVLQCTVCRTRWSYPRAQCAICMTTDEDKLEYFYSKDDEAHLVYVCNNCHKYIKTTDERKIGHDVDLDVEDLATIDLDFIAKDKGYEPGGRVTFAIGSVT